MTWPSPFVPSPSRRAWPFDGGYVAALIAGPLGAGALGLAGLLPPRSPGSGPLDALGVAALLVVAPICEEAVFRLFLQGWLAATRFGQRRLAGLSVANIAASAIFAIAHLGAHPVAWAAATFLPSLVFGHFREAHLRLASPIVLHIVYNASYLLACLLAG